MPAATSTANLSPESPLFRLPAELRNKIYRLVLLRDRTIYVHRNEDQETGLLQACQRLRSETSSICYLENDLSLVIRHWSCATLLRLAAKEAQLGGASISSRHLRVDWPDWRNLALWLWHYRCGHLRKARVLPRPREGVGRLATEHILAAMFEQVDAVEGQTWELVTKVLALLYHLLVGIVERWKVATEDIWKGVELHL